MMFQRHGMQATTHADGHQTESVTWMSSSDEKFSSGMYYSSKTRIGINKPYGVNEFIYFLSGGVTLTSSDGSVMTVHAGEAAHCPGAGHLPAPACVNAFTAKGFGTDTCSQAEYPNLGGSIP